MSLVLDNAPSVVSRAEVFREHADECRRQAEGSRDPADKERWLKIAEKWFKIAHETEEDRPQSEAALGGWIGTGGLGIGCSRCSDGSLRDSCPGRSLSPLKHGCSH